MGRTTEIGRANAVATPPGRDAALDASRRLGELPSDRRVALGAAALRTFFNFANVWELSVADQQALLGDISRSSVHAWRQQAPDTPDTYRTDLLTRLSLLLGIGGMLQRLFGSTPAFADAWIGSVNRAAPFRGRSPLALMVEEGIPGLLTVRRLLEAQAGGSLQDADTLAWDGSPMYTSAALVAGAQNATVL